MANDLTSKPLDSSTAALPTIERFIDSGTQAGHLDDHDEIVVNGNRIKVEDYVDPNGRFSSCGTPAERLAQVTRAFKPGYLLNSSRPKILSSPSQPSVWTAWKELVDERKRAGTLYKGKGITNEEVRNRVRKLQAEASADDKK